MAGDSIGKLSAIITADSRGFQRATENVRQHARHLKEGVAHDLKSIGEFRLPGMLPIAGGVALAELPMKMLEKTVEVGREAVRMFLEIAREMHEIQVTADRLHVGVVEFQLMRIAAAGAGVEIQTVVMGLERMQRHISEAVKGAAQQVELFREIGLSAARLEEMSPDRAFREIAFALAEIENPMERTRLEMELFGKSGARLRLFLDQATGGFDAFREIVADEATVEQLAEIAHTLELVTLGIKALAAQAMHFAVEDAKVLIDAFQRIADAMPPEVRMLMMGGVAALATLPGVAETRALVKEVRRGKELDEAFKPFREAEAAEARFWDQLNDSLDHAIDKRAEWASEYDKTRAKIEGMGAKLAEGYSEAAAAAQDFLDKAKQSGIYQDWQIAEMKLGLELLARQVETAKEYAEARKQAAAATERAKSEEEKFAEAVQKAHEWQTMGIISAQDEARLVKRAQDDLVKHWQSGERWEPAPLARRGSAEEYGIIAKAVTAAQQNQALTSRLDTIAQNTADTARAVERAKSDGGRIVSIPP